MRQVNIWISLIGLMFITYIAWGALAPIREEFSSGFGARVDSGLSAETAAADSNIDDHYGTAFNMMPVFITGILLYIGYISMQSRERVYQGGF